MIKLNNKTIGSAFLGSTPISKIYKGDLLIFESSPTFGFTVSTTEDGTFSYMINGVENSIELTARLPKFIKVDEVLSDLSRMFLSKSNINYLDVSKLDTSLVTTMDYTFNGCTLLTSLDLENWNTDNVINMSYMFGYSRGITTLSLNFNTENVIDMSGIFANCEKLSNIRNLTLWNTSKVTDMSRMFLNCLKLGQFGLDLSNFDTSKVTDMSLMFYSCSVLSSLDISNFDISKVTEMTNMFKYCSKLTKIKCKLAFKDWAIANKDTILLPTIKTWEIVD